MSAERTYRIYGNSGEYVMPHTPEFPSRESAREYARTWWPDNRHVVIR